MCPDCEPYTKLLRLAQMTRIAKLAADAAYDGLARLAEELGEGQVAWADAQEYEDDPRVYWRTYRPWKREGKWTVGMGVAVQGRDGGPQNVAYGRRFFRYELRWRRAAIRFHRMRSRLDARIKLAVEAA